MKFGEAICLCVFDFAPRPAFIGSSDMSNFNQESVLSVHHWTDTLFSFTTTRDPSFRFRNGEFTMIGLKVGEKPLLRAYSVASANYEDRLEFFSIKVPDGPLTSRLQHLKEGEQIIVGRKATGTLVIDNLKNGRNLILLAPAPGWRRSEVSSRTRKPMTVSRKSCCCTVAAMSPSSPMAR
jgi:hypothetical protein